MAVHFEIKHTTTYSYTNPVTFGTHRAMFLPRPAARGRLLNWSAKTSLPSKIRWVSDALANNITMMEFSEPSKELAFAFQFQGIHFGAKRVEEFPLEPRAEEVPVQYTPDEWTDLSSICAPIPRTPTPVLPPGPSVLPPIARVERLTSYDECWTRSTTPSATMPGKLKVLSLPVKPCARSQVPAGITLGL